ncbi:MAG TPA: toll/interleukin-1 receptor domain-containing protein [Flavobacteriales bacterium]|nr:toll/interleukin-1 receptor domain-containing protein [Flavobacteriales bacterium]
MSIFTKASFEAAANRNAGYKNFRAYLEENRKSYRSTKTTSVFLSHAHTDKDIVQQAVTFFSTLGISIYVDWMDETMPDKPNGDTAKRIKDRIQANDKFILLATNAAVASKWCNWELGIGDLNKFDKGKLAVLPLADNSGTWQGNEYLRLYPRIEYGSTNSSDLWVWHPDRFLPEYLRTWLMK